MDEMSPSNGHMRRCAVSSVVAAYENIRLTPSALRALPIAHFTATSSTNFN